MASPVLEVETLDDVTVARLNTTCLGEWDAESLGKQLFSLAEHLGRRKLHLDLGAVEYLTSTALGKFITLNKKVRSEGGELSFRNVCQPLYELFTLTRLTSVLDVRQKPAEVLSAPAVLA